MERQGRAPIDWDLHRNLPIPAAPDSDLEQQNDERNDVQNDIIGRPSLVLPTPPAPPPQPLWHQDLHHSSWPRHNVHRSELVSRPALAGSFFPSWFWCMSFLDSFTGLIGIENELKGNCPFS